RRGTSGTASWSDAATNYSSRFSPGRYEHAGRLASRSPEWHIGQLSALRSLVKRPGLRMDSPAVAWARPSTWHFSHAIPGTYAREYLTLPRSSSNPNDVA